MPLLTIAIPTYNRKDELDQCLSSFQDNMAGLYDKIDFFISDNNSNYDVSEIISNYSKNLNIDYVINDTNLGMTKNFINCLKMAKNQYVWLFSDDEKITNNCLSIIVKAIEENGPDYIFLRNSRVKKNKNIKKIDLIKCDKDLLISYCGVFSTLITSNIFKKDLIAHLLVKNYNTMFPHFQIYLEVLKNNNNFLVVDGDLFQTTSNNSSGYQWFKVFVDDLNKLIDCYTAVISKKNRKLIDRQLLLIIYYKHYLYSGFCDTGLNRYEYESFESVYKMIKTRFKKNILFWLFYFPPYVLGPYVRKVIYSLITKIIMPIYRKRY